MEVQAQLVDICVVCALPDEVRAFLEVVRQQCNVDFEELIDSQYKYDYRLTTIKNDRGEPLVLHVSWLPRYGPQEMVLHLQRVLEVYQPRIAVMTGICAGDSQQVQLGDLVVAERTFTYDNGKFILDERGRRVHLHDTTTYQLDANILQFLGLFDEWKPLIACMERPLSTPEQREIACHLKPMASGNAVRSDQPFEDVRAPVRGTVAIDMEGAAFGLVMSRHPLIPWLVVKGVCDYADQDKNDVYHDYAARASALYALSFIRAYVTNERLPRLDGSSPSSRAGPSEIWNIPYPRNPVFTGREHLLAQLAEALKPGEAVVLAQPQAISGLGGIGKTQIAVEYAYQHRQDYQAVLWTLADTRESLISGYVEMARRLNLPEKDEQDQQLVVKAVQEWLKQQRRWLLIFDNADDLTLAREFFPPIYGGHIVLTTRAQALGRVAQRIEVDTLDQEVGALLLLRRAGLVGLHASLDAALPSDITLAKVITQELGGLPLALDQAGAYIEETLCGLAGYQRLYQVRRTELLRRRGGVIADHPESVATTWSLSFEQVEQRNPAAADLLRLCAFLAPDAIPEELLTQGAEGLGDVLAPVVTDAYQLDQAITALLAFSFISRDPQTQALTVHRLVQVVLRDSMPAETQRQWMQRAVKAVNAAFPTGEFTTWPVCERLLPHALVCSTWIEREELEVPEEAYLLNQAGHYLIERGRYEEAEPLLKLALATRERLLGAEHQDIAGYLNNLATLYERRGKYEEAESLLERALTMKEQQLGVEHLSTLGTLNNLATLYQKQGKYEIAESFFERVLVAREKQLGAEHPATAASLNNLASMYVLQGRYAEAEPLFKRALVIKEQQLGTDHPDTVGSLDNLAVVYQEQGNYTEAELLFQRALATRERQLGAEHPDAAMSMNNLAVLYVRQGRYAEAEPLFQQALAIRERQLGAEHPDTITSLHDLAALYVQQERFEKAEPLFQRALAIRERQLGAEHPDTTTSMHNLAVLYVRQGRYAEAEPLFQRALAIRERQLGAEHPRTQIARENYTRLLQLMKQKEE